jgi:hypothetical protein
MEAIRPLETYGTTRSTQRPIVEQLNLQEKASPHLYPLDTLKILFVQTNFTELGVPKLRAINRGPQNVIEKKQYSVGIS